MIGFIAACCTTFSLVPQVIKVMKERRTESISLGMYILQVIGLSLWLIHGITIVDYPLILANSISVFFAIIVLIYKLRYK